MPVGPRGKWKSVKGGLEGKRERGKRRTEEDVEHGSAEAGSDGHGLWEMEERVR
jgi:hypothetical protein